MHTPLRPFIHIRRFSTIDPKPLDWLWQPRIPRGKLTLLAGDPGSGKTTLLLHLASRLSRGAPMPHSPQSKIENQKSKIPSDPATSLSIVHSPLSIPSATLLLSPEDNLADTLRPKLDRLGADPSQLHTLPDLHSLSDPTAALHPETQKPLTAFEYLEAAIQSIPNLALLIIDPITYYLGMTDKSLRYRSAAQAAKPRTILHSLAALAEKYNLAIVLTTRLAKKLPEKNASLASLRRALGSLAFTSAARSVLLLHNDLDQPHRHLLITIKSNLADPPPPIAFHLTDQLQWEDDPTTLPADAKKPDTQKELNENSFVADAADFLHHVLADGPKKAKEIQYEATQLGISTASLRRARIHLNLPCKYSKKRGYWYVSLPGDTRPVNSESQDLENAMRTFEESDDIFSTILQKLEL